MPEISERSESILNSVPDDVLTNVANTRRYIRERAIHTLTISLNPELEEDKKVYQELPLGIMKKGDIIAAIWYIETIGRLGNEIEWENVAQIIRTAIDEKTTCENFGDEEAASEILKSLKSLFKMAVNHVGYAQIDELYILMGNIEEIYGDTQRAIGHYNRAVELHSAGGYIAVSDAYVKLGQGDESVKVLEKGFILTGDQSILSRLITALYLVGRKEDALNRYNYLKNLDKNPIPPFIVYTGTIESDEDLVELEEIFAEYLGQGNIVPLESFHKLSIAASKYITDGIRRENIRIDELGNKDFENWTDEKGNDYIRAIQKRLYYMQVDILSLRNQRGVLKSNATFIFHKNFMRS